jgi:hypothetical protein
MIRDGAQNGIQSSDAKVLVGGNGEAHTWVSIHEVT